MKDKVVIVTGGTRGIGAGISQAFLESGATVIAVYRNNVQKAQLFEQAMQQYGDCLSIIQADVSSGKDRLHLIAQVIQRYGRIDVLVNNAGRVIGASLFEETEQQFDEIIATNLKAPIFLAQACAKHMVEQGIAGSIVNITSVSAKMPNATMNYCASKAGLAMASKKMAHKLAKYHIRVNVVVPGTIRSDMNRPYWQDNPEAWQEHVKQLPMERGGEPNELAAAVVFLSSDQASFITGTELVVDGGNLLKPSW